MVPSRELQHVIDQQVFPGTFVFHGISRPVIRKIDNRYCIAMFVTLFNMQSFVDGLFDRPDYWISADIETGKLIWVYQCNMDQAEEFCDSIYARRYDLRDVSDKRFNDKYFDNAYDMLDEVRSKIISTGELDELLYKLYMKRILSACPLPYRKFFRDLSGLVQ